MAVNATKDSALDVRLPLTPEQTDDDKAFREFQIIYSAIRGIQAFIQARLFGLSQSYADQKANRAFGTTYTNDTDKPRWIHISCTGTTGSYLTGTINGLAGFDGDESPNTSHRMQLLLMIPPRGTYTVAIGAGTPIVLTWYEYN